MKVKVNYMSQIRKATDKSEEIIELSQPCTVQELIKNNLCNKHEKLKGLVLEENGILRSIILIFHGDVKITEDNPRELRDGDSITIMAPITGG